MFPPPDALPPEGAPGPDAGGLPPSDLDAGAPDGASATADAAAGDGSTGARDAGSPDDGGLRDAGPDGCAAGDGCAAPVQSLLVSLPCVSPAGVNSCTVAGDQTASATVEGSVGTVYDVRLRIRGVVEPKTYPGACRLSTDSPPSDSWAVGGVAGDDMHNVYQLSISSPPQTYDLNESPPTGAGTMAIDFEQTVHVAGGAMITLTAQSEDRFQFGNFGANGAPLTVPGTLVPQPYDGQFVQVDLMSVQGQTFPAADPGMALSFMGAQTVTVPDAPSLRPTDVTLEAWFEYEGFDADPEVLVGKPYANGTEDSYAIWYQTVFSSGVTLDSPQAATSFEWYPVFGEWHHAAMTYDSVSRQTIFYFDGVPSACAASSGPLVYDDHPFLIGVDSDYEDLFGFWVGTIDEVRVFSRARTPDQVWADMHTDRLGPAPDLAAEWTFDDSDGQTAADSSGNGNTATLGVTASPEPADPTWIRSTLQR